MMKVHTGCRVTLAFELPGYVKGYALLEYADKKFAERAIAEADGAELLGRPIHVEWAFVKAPRSYVSQLI